MKVINCSLNDLKRFYGRKHNLNIIMFSGTESFDKDMIYRLFEWVKGKKDIIVACNDLSKSAAVAYMIDCATIPVDHAINNIKFRWRIPDEKIVDIGSNVLGNKKMLKKLERKKRKLPCLSC